MTSKNNLSIRNDKVRHVFDEKTGKWYFSVVDIVDIFVQTSNPRNYWKVFKNRLNKRDKQLVTNCNQLKLQASDGKFYLTDVADINTITEILKLVSPKNILAFRAWAMTLGTQKNTKITPPSLRKMPAEISRKKKSESYPQEKTYNVANLIRKFKN